MEIYMDDDKSRLSKKRSSSSRQSDDGGSPRGSSSSRPKARKVKAGSRSSSFTGLCTGLVKEQRARFYIMRRCITMLICWNDCP
ncbi:uncharacterized protein M6B38_322355 [Iris pallida]|uniref:ROTUNDIFOLIA like 8 n=1 Tax=Iris pallida TaxID=29817 RepID=A0AAX6HBJ6_IRIPA|nr:uncharacterized protein M6B38_322355 [Iris pallida]